MLRTMIVDDEPLAIERMQVLCAEIDELAVIGTASDGEAALRLADKLKPDLMLLDMTMPGIDGLTVARQLGRRPDPPAVIFVTAHEDFAVEAFDLEAVDYVLKPVAADRLERAIDRAVARREHSQTGGGEWLSEFWVPHRLGGSAPTLAEANQLDADEAAEKAARRAQRPETENG